MKQRLRLSLSELIIISLMVLDMISPYLPKLNNLMIRLSNIDDMFAFPLLLTIRLIVLGLLVLIALRFLLKIFNKTKKDLQASKLNKDKIHEKLKTLPKEYMDKILLILLKSKKLSWMRICALFDDEKMKILSYVLLLEKAKYIKLHNPKNIKAIIKITLLPYKLTRKGKRYIKENNLLNQTHL